MDEKGPPIPPRMASSRGDKNGTSGSSDKKEKKSAWPFGRKNQGVCVCVCVCVRVCMCTYA